MLNASLAHSTIARGKLAARDTSDAPGDVESRDGGLRRTGEPARHERYEQESGPESGSTRHIAENAAATRLTPDSGDLARLEEASPI